MIKDSRKVLLVLLLTIGLTSFATAQGTLSGSVSGRVVDSENYAIPGCSVTLEGSNLQGLMTFVTSDTGSFRFPSVPPGEGYQLTFDMPGFQTTIRKDIRVSLGKRTTINITLIMSALEEVITVAGESPTIDVITSKTAVNYSKSYIYNIPMSRDLYDILNSVPGSVSEDASYRRTTYISGGTVRGNQYAIDGVTINDPVAMYPMTNISIDVYEEVEMGLSGHSAEVGIADGGFINIVTKSGGNVYHGGGTAEYYNGSLVEDLLSQVDLEAVGLQAPSGWNNWKDFSLFFGGPIIKNTVWFFANGRYFTWERDFNHIIWDETQDMGKRVYTMDQAPHKERDFFGKLTFQLAPHIRLMTALNQSTIREDFYTNRIDSNRDITATTTWDEEKGHTISGQINWVLNQNLFVDIRMGYISRFFPIPFSDFAIPNAPQNYDRYYDIYRNNPRFEETYLRKRLNPSITFTLFKDNLFGLSHEFKAGAEFEATSGKWDWWRRNPFGINYYKGGPSYPTVSEPDRYTIYSFICGPTEGSSVQENNMKHFGAFFQDSITIGERLTLNLGLRFDTSKGSFPEQIKAASADPYGLLATLGESPFSDYKLPAMDVFTWTHLSPRLGFAYDLFGDGKTNVKASWSRYNEYLMIQYYSLANPNSPNSGEWYWYDDNQNGTIDPVADRFDLIYLPPDPFTFSLEGEVDLDATAPYTDELTLGIDREMAKDFSITLTGIYKHKQNIFEDVNDYGLGKVDAWKGYAENSPYWKKISFADPGDDGMFGTEDDLNSFAYVELADAPDTHYFLTNVVGSYRKYMALLLLFNKRMSDRWQLLASFVWSKTWGNIGGDYDSTSGVSGSFNTPNSFVFSDGRLGQDRPLNIKIQSTVILPWDVIFSLYFNHRSGSPWARSVTVYLPDDTAYKWDGDVYSVATEEIGTRRNPSLTTLDIRVEKRFHLGEAFTLGGYIDILNALGRSGYGIASNPGGYIDYSAGWDQPPTFERYSSYGDVTSAYGNRTFKFSLRFTF
ncbi:MAG: TonB-dependent receptor [Candidatus Aminicenantes bacterium]|nr:TonB-dependent receptor [Candidatus Aminicenantes bacterium]